ncbi:PPIC-type PPIASE domain-containing protein [Microbulbifer donghaiensis]|uniref:peptidylprolyl isomerase n=1 Tax=Microbulbifer donghaiensis TaxID=494016 RepID=A0A1M5H775_9GAMM|nr:peptidylprolyl isomerase [Microbulbifer donghaiensis]SHG11743.1 PPIC-type PPIASE domain-containing protein [Microbulbifer donghaiensis]
MTLNTRKRINAETEPVVGSGRPGRDPFFLRSARRLLREPLVHFLVLGAALFAGYDYLYSGDRDESPHQIALTLDELRQLGLLFNAQWRRQPTPEEFSQLVEFKIRQEVLYREALAMGLDKNDEIVKRRMAQKMQFLAEDVAAAREPTTEELKTWYEKNSDKFSLPSRVSFRHLYFSPDRRGARARDDAAQALAELAGQPEESTPTESLADRFMFQDYYADRTSESLAKDFGPEFAVAAPKLPLGSWQGPLESGYGWHLVYVDSLTPGRVPAFEEIEPDVKTAWLGAQKEAAWAKAYREMRAKYTVLLPAPPNSDTVSVASDTDTLTQGSGAPL